MIRVGFADDHGVVRLGLRHLFSTQTDMRVVGAATDGREAIDLVRENTIDVLVLDLDMPGQGGLDSLLMIKAKSPNTKVLIFSEHPAVHYAKHCLQKGANGYLNKACDPAEIVEAVRLVASGRNFISHEVGELLAKSLKNEDEGLPHMQLSAREMQVFLKLARGETTASVSENLSISIKTVSTYRSRLLEKMNLKSNSDLTYYAMSHRMIS